MMFPTRILQNKISIKQNCNIFLSQDPSFKLFHPRLERNKVKYDPQECLITWTFRWTCLDPSEHQSCFVSVVVSLFASCHTLLLSARVEGKLVSTRVPSTPGSLQRSRSDIDVNAASSAKSRLSTVPASSPFSSAAALPPGSYASLGNSSVICR